MVVLSREGKVGHYLHLTFYPRKFTLQHARCNRLLSFGEELVLYKRVSVTIVQLMANNG